MYRYLQFYYDFILTFIGTFNNCKGRQEINLNDKIDAIHKAPFISMNNIRVKDVNKFYTT